MRSSIVRSAPPQKASLPEVMTTPLMAASPSIFATRAESSSITSSVSTFIERPGMSQVISAMPSASVSRLKFAMTLGSYGIRLAVFLGVTKAFIVADDLHIDVGIMRALDSRARADLDKSRIAIRAVDQTVAIGNTGPPGGAVAGLKHRLAVILA